METGLCFLYLSLVLSVEVQIWVNMEGLEVSAFGFVLFFGETCSFLSYSTNKTKFLFCDEKLLHKLWSINVLPNFKRKNVSET